MGDQQTTETAKPCEAIIAEFVWGPLRCGEPSTAQAIDETWGTVHPVCTEHDPEHPLTTPPGQPGGTS